MVPPRLRYVLPCLLVTLVTLNLPLGASQSTVQSKESGVDPAINSLLSAIRAADKGQLAISEEDGRFLRVLVGATKAQRILEIGGASGYSAIWMGLGLRQTGGRMVTIEYDPVRAKELAANVEKAGLSDIVRVVAGDAFKEDRKSTRLNSSHSQQSRMPSSA